MREWITLGLLCFGLPLYGQQATARIMGTVSDPSSATIGGAAVTVTSVATSQQRSALTSSSGEYSIPFLPIGEYTVLVQAPGFQPKSLKGIVLQVDQEARFDVTLNLGSATDAVTVQAESPLLVTDVSSVGQVIENKAIINMPLNGRAFWQLAQLTPGVVFTPGGSDITSGGQGIRATRVGLRISAAAGWPVVGFSTDLTFTGSSPKSVTGVEAS
jgi:Carboxypeptidase regulatory-like domain